MSDTAKSEANCGTRTLPADGDGARPASAVETLAPCPFCGTLPRLCEDDSYGMAQVFCANTACPAEPAVIGQTETVQRVIADWNRRAAAPPPQAPGGVSNDLSNLDLASPHRAAQAPGWRPISTAPKDRPVLATWAKTWATGQPHIEVCECGEEGRWFYSFDGDCPTERQGEPTHWMPLPAPPTSPAPTGEPT